MQIRRVTRLMVVWVAVLSAVPAMAGQAARSAADAPTFARDVAPILYTHCVNCHRPGEIGPMSLITYRDVRPWLTAVRDRVVARSMPPWFADPRHGKFTNERRLSDREIDTIVKWVSSGAREGDPKDLPAVPQLVEGWQIGKPDVVLEMPAEFEIPATGTVDYKYFEVPTNFTKDMWVQAAEVRAGVRSNVHHAIVSVIEPVKTNRPASFETEQLLGPGETPTPRAPRTGEADPVAARRAGSVNLVNWALGEEPPVYPRGTAKRIPAGSTLVFQLHYTTNGTPARDRSKIGLIFAKEPPQLEMRTGSITNSQFLIPAGAANHRVEAEATFTESIKVWTLHPHMHLRGKSMTYTVIYPDGRREVALSVPGYNPNWQGDYYLAEPLSVPKGARIRVTAHFDNSPANRHNPNPAEAVKWGDQTWEEMMIGWLTYTVDKSDGRATDGQ